jgi:hypothetical protein
VKDEEGHSGVGPGLVAAVKVSHQYVPLPPPVMTTASPFAENRVAGLMGA